MRAVLQRVSRAAVQVSGEVTGQIGPGLVVLLGVARDDAEQDADYLANKVVEARVFPDDQDRMNLSVQEAGGEVLVVSQFTLLGDLRKGRRPSYDTAAPPETARSLYERFVAEVQRRGVPVATGVFQARMEVELVNAGPVTILLDSRRLF